MTPATSANYQKWDWIRFPESTLTGFCVFPWDLDQDLESKICEKPDPDPKSLFQFGCSWSLCGHFLGKNMGNRRFDR